MKMKKAVFGSTGKNINMMRGFACRSDAAAVILPRGRVLHPPPTRRHHQRSTLFVTNNEKYMRLVQQPRHAFRDYSPSPSSATSSKTLLLTCGGGGGSAASLALAPIRKASGDDVRREKALKPPASTLSSSNDTHVFQVVVMRVSLHCQGCASKVKKHLSKMEGVTSFSIDLESKKVTVMGNVSPVGVLESVSKVKRAEFWPC